MRALSAAAAILLVAFAGAAHAAESSLRLVPLVERIARLHAQAGQGVMAQRSRKALGEAIREFDGALRAALAAAPGPEARENYVLLAMLWQDYRDWAQRPPTRETGRKLEGAHQEPDQQHLLKRMERFGGKCHQCRGQNDTDRVRRTKHQVTRGAVERTQDGADDG